MDESFCVPDNKYPDGEPGDDWTVEELLHWSLSQYHSKVRDRTSANIESLRNQCEKQCDDVGTLHKLAVDNNSIMAKKGGSCSNSTAEGIADEENVDPQSSAVSDPAAGVQKATLAKASSTISSSSTVTATAAAAATNKSASSNSSGNNKTTIEILVIVGPHAGSKYVLRPKPGAPCHVGRSKGKKFIKNGVSLTRDQEVSTTHGKFVVEYHTGGIEAAAAAAGGGGNNNKFYFIDVGSTNGSVYDGEQLEPNDRLPLWSGMELKVGNSVMKIVLG